MCAHACHFFYFLLFLQLCRFHYYNFFVIVMKAFVFRFCCVRNIGVKKLKIRFFASKVRTHLNICCFCVSYKWKNNNNSCRLFTSTKALRCSLFSAFHSRGCLLLLLSPLFLFSRPIFAVIHCMHHVRTFRYYVIAIPLILHFHVFFFLALFHSLYFYFNTSF